VLDPRITRHVQVSFPRDTVEGILHRLDTWRLSYRTRERRERLVAAVVLLADGDAPGIERAINLAERDWRDLLVAAGLAQADWETELTRRLRG
jgi:hypothetical protein